MIREKLISSAQKIKLPGDDALEQYRNNRDIASHKLKGTSKNPSLNFLLRQKKCSNAHIQKKITIFFSMLRFSHFFFLV